MKSGGHTFDTLNFRAQRRVDAPRGPDAAGHLGNELPGDAEFPCYSALQPPVKEGLSQDVRGNLVALLDNGSHVSRHLYKCLDVDVKGKMPESRKKTAGTGEVGERIVRFRLRIGFNQVDLAQTIGMTQPNISSWENGKSLPTFESYAKLITLAGTKGAEDDRQYFLAKVRDSLIENGIDPRELQPRWDGATERRAVGQTHGAFGKLHAGGGATRRKERHKAG